MIVKPDYAEMSRAAARMVSDAIHARPQLRLCVAAGNTPTGAYRELARLCQAEALDFSKVTFFYLDDYVGLAAEHPESFRTYLERELFGKLNVTRANIHGPDANYEETIRNCGGIDLLICGIGKNGHIAFNEPGSAMESRTRIVDLAESTTEGLRGKFQPEELPRQAITMGLATIMESREILLLANGREKSGILERAMRGPVTTSVPASVLQKHSKGTVITDQVLAESQGNGIS
jgi:glucosamine-6-phosphate deaminase